MKKNEIYSTLNKAYFSEECDEKEVIKHLPELLQDVKVFVDIGASLGQYTFHANKYMKKGQIFAIEADPIRFEKLQLNCEEWQKMSTNKLVAINAAVSDRDDQIKFHITNSSVSGGLFRHSLNHLTENDRAKVQWEEISIDSYRLDTLFKDTNPDFIKMDVEGTEWRALKGSQSLLINDNVSFLIELHSWGDSDKQGKPDQVIKFMKSYGYNSQNFYGKTLFHKKTHSGFKSIIGLQVSRFLSKFKE